MNETYDVIEEMKKKLKDAQLKFNKLKSILQEYKEKRENAQEETITLPMIDIDNEEWRLFEDEEEEINEENDKSGEEEEKAEETSGQKKEEKNGDDEKEKPEENVETIKEEVKKEKKEELKEEEKKEEKIVNAENDDAEQKEENVKPKKGKRSASRVPLVDIILDSLDLISKKIPDDISTKSVVNEEVEISENDLIILKNAKTKLNNVIYAQAILLVVLVVSLILIAYLF